MELAKYYQVKTREGVPQTSAGPALASDGANNLFMAYIGQDGSNVWLASLNGSLAASQQWLSNQQVKIDRVNALKSNSAPALVFFKGKLVMFTTTEDNVTCSFFDGSEWHSNFINYPFFGVVDGYVSCSASVVNGSVHLVVSNRNYGIKYAIASDNLLDIRSWRTITNVTVSNIAAYDLVAVDNRSLLAFAGGKGPLYSFVDASSAVQFQIQEQAIEPTSSSPMISSRMRLYWNELPVILYAPPGQSSLYTAGWAAYVANGGLGGQNMLLRNSLLVTSGGTTAKTSAAPAIIRHQNWTCIAHKGESGANIWFGYGSLNI